MSLPRIKVCGITRFEDAELAMSLGAWALGFVFYPASPRAVKPDQAGAVIRALGPTAPLCVGVFVDENPATIAAVIEISGIKAIQLHGDETPEYCANLRAILPNIQIFKAVAPRSNADIAAASHYREVCDRILLDTYVSGVRGGSGVVGDWYKAKSLDFPIILAGGINQGNIRAALDEVDPYAIDVSSGLESAPGKKSPEKMRRLFANARGGNL